MLLPFRGKEHSRLLLCEIPNLISEPVPTAGTVPQCRSAFLKLSDIAGSAGSDTGSQDQSTVPPLRQGAQGRTVPGHEHSVYVAQ
jgi:hypothetical protein